MMFSFLIIYFSNINIRHLKLTNTPDLGLFRVTHGESATLLLYIDKRTIF